MTTPPPETTGPAGPSGATGATGPTGPVNEGIEQRFASLEASNLLLSSDIQALTQALTVVNQLALRQRELQRKNDEVQAKVRSVEDVARARAKRTQRVATTSAIGLAILLPLASLLVYWILFNQVTDLLNQTYADRMRSCDARNAATMANISRETQLSLVELDPEIAAIHRDSARELAKGVVDCEATIRLVVRTQG